MIINAELFWAKVHIACGCWLWRAGQSGNGYGKFYVIEPKRMMYAHRVSWMLTHNEELTRDQLVLHRCDNRQCVNPDHLFLGDDAANMRDKSNKGRHHYQNRTLCKHGHPYTPESTYVIPGTPGWKDCKICRDVRLKIYAEDHA